MPVKTNFVITVRQPVVDELICNCWKRVDCNWNPSFVWQWLHQLQLAPYWRPYMWQFINHCQYFVFTEVHKKAPASPWLGFPQGKRKRGHPRNSWWHNTGTEIKKMGSTWKVVEWTAQARVCWGGVVNDLCSSWSNRPKLGSNWSTY